MNWFGIVSICLLLVLVTLAVFVLIRNMKTYVLLTAAGVLIYAWILKKIETDEDFDWSIDWYNELLKSYGKILWNPFAVDIQHAFKNKKQLKEILDVLTPEDISKAFRENKGDFFF